MGASFAADLARASGIEPSRVRRALLELSGRGLATNDRFDPMRAGADATLSALAEASQARAGGRSLRIRPRRSIAGPRRGTLVAPGPRPGRCRGPAAGLGRAPCSSATACSAARSSRWSRRRPPGASWLRSWRAPSGAARSAAATSSRGSPGVQYATEEAAAELARLAAAPRARVAGRPRSPRSTRPIFTAPARRWTSSCSTAAGPAAAGRRQFPGDPRRASRPDRRVVRQAADRRCPGPPRPTSIPH